MSSFGVALMGGCLIITFVLATGAVIARKRSEILLVSLLGALVFFGLFGIVGFILASSYLRP